MDSPRDERASQDREARRLVEFARFEFLLDAPNETFDEICSLACAMFGVAHAHVTLLGAERGHYLTQSSIGRKSFDRATSFTRHVFEESSVSVVSDVLAEERFKDIKSFHRARFLAAAPLWLSSDISLGVLSIFDSHVRTLTPSEREHFSSLAILVVNELRRQRGLLDLQQREALLVQARDDANAANIAKSSFLAAMSHEIRTPLNGILGMAQAMAGDGLTPLQAERLSVISESGETLLVLLNDILDLAKIEAGKLELEIGEVDIDALVRYSQSAFETIAKARTVEFSVSAPGIAGQVFRGDPTRIRQILNNLISNALKFTARGAVRVVLCQAGSDLLLTVKDTGAGIAPEALSRLFHKFVQADASTTRRYGGTGLGLSICRQLCELMGGAVTVSSELGVGSTFVVRLPLKRVASAERAVIASRASPLRYEKRSMRVLAAEDNAINQKVLQALLSQIGVEPHIVSNGKEVVRAWESGVWDLILMDIQMPEMDGREATAAIRSVEAKLGRVRTPIVALTADSMSHQTAAYEWWEMDGFIGKPIVSSQLRELIDKYDAASPQRTDDTASGTIVESEPSL